MSDFPLCGRVFCSRNLVRVHVKVFHVSRLRVHATEFLGESDYSRFAAPQRELQRDKVNNFGSTKIASGSVVSCTGLGRRGVSTNGFVRECVCGTCVYLWQLVDFTVFRSNQRRP